MIVGMIMGSDGLGIIYFNNPELAQLIGIIALVVILLKAVCKQSGLRSKRSPFLHCRSRRLAFADHLRGCGCRQADFNVSWMEGFYSERLSALQTQPRFRRIERPEY
ncbi:hypothetical protein PO124_15010 [Bacillus licheniformis]|nr:hypothetical protein [Bacillus licheniformis]